MTVKKTVGNIAGAFLATSIGVVMLLGIAEIGIRLLKTDWREFDAGTFMTTTKIRGLPTFSIGRDGYQGRFSQNNGDFRTQVRINEFGLRNDEPLSAAQNRVWIVGDSMTFGWGVEREETFGAVLQQLSGRSTYSVASPGCNICGYHALIARMPSDLKPSGVVLGLVLENDIRTYDCLAEGKAEDENPAAGDDSHLSSVMQVKVWLTGHSAVYNLVTASAKRVPALTEGLITLGLVNRPHADHQVAASSPRPEEVASSANEIDLLRQRLPEGTPFVVLVAPGRAELANGDPYYRLLRQKMTTALAERHIDVIDMHSTFAVAGFAPTHFAHDGHWTALGHRLAGQALADWFARH